MGRVTLPYGKTMAEPSKVAIMGLTNGSTLTNERTDGLTKNPTCDKSESYVSQRARKTETPSPQFRVLVTGSRSWPSQDLVWEALGMVCCERLPDGGTLTVVHGACPTGADYFAHTWFYLPNDPEYVTVEEPHPADWDACTVDCVHAPRRNRFGRMYCPVAGYRRNQEMVDLGADLVLAFPLPGPRTRSRGTWDCVKRAEAAGIPVEVQSLDFQPRLSFAEVAEAVGAVDEAVRDEA